MSAGGFSGTLAQGIPFPYEFLNQEERERFSRASYLVTVLRRHKGRIEDAFKELQHADEAQIVEQMHSGMQRQLRQAQEAKLPALLQHFEIATGSEETDWKELALTLARIIVPGFRPVKSKGAPRTGKSNDERIGLFVTWKMEQSPKESVIWAANNLKNDFPDIASKTGGEIRAAYYRWQKTEFAEWLRAQRLRTPKEYRLMLNWVCEKGE